eukprot:CAMPEP_0178413050 /NCGR_PEP_ID=MMETSP0689_2-20121128/22330_1 /TAXON_ID=160604 /ORGANISM="Amphidinium massartii, Strain CS-259" /LENGTH=318 /DNA_ID=CAMNT_0020034315 /DNA_START=201 /DNA_END=1157 /DNA_ORIENTATION=-
MGANWANTLRLYRDIAPPHRINSSWEIYAFEANPIIQPYVEKFVRYLNGAGEKPAITVPPAGSTAHLGWYAKYYGCPWSWAAADQMRACMWKVFERPLAALRGDPLLNSTALVKQRLAEARHPLDPGASKTRFTFIPAAVGVHDGWLHMADTSTGQSIRGGAVAKDAKEESSGEIISVVAADVVTWMINSFTKQDYVVVKMDVEGAEFDILDGLYRAGKLGLIDLLAMECHGFAEAPFVARNPDAVFRTCSGMPALLKSSHIPVIAEGEGYDGCDSMSRPHKYKPIDPRKKPQEQAGAPLPQSEACRTETHCLDTIDR